MCKNSFSLILMTLLTCTLFIFASVSFGVTEDIVTISELVEGLKVYDDQIVIIEVEAIGDKMVRGSELVFNGLDATGAIGIWAPAEMSDTINRMGNYDQIGDLLKITGTYHLNCAEHGGDSDIHAERILLVKEGHVVKHPISRGKRLMFEVSSLALILVIGLSMWILKKKRP